VLLCLDSVRYIYVPCVVKVRLRNRLGCNRKGGEKRGWEIGYSRGSVGWVYGSVKKRRQEQKESTRSLFPPLYGSYSSGSVPSIPRVVYTEKGRAYSSHTRQQHQVIGFTQPHQQSKTTIFRPSQFIITISQFLVSYSSWLLIGKDNSNVT
jgi:hypothetical protein